MRKFSKEPTLKRGIFWIQHDQCGHSEWNIAIGFAGEYLSRNCPERAESFSDRSEKGKYRSLKCWNLEYYHPSEVHPHTSAICMHTMFEQAPVSGLAITCMKTVLEHGCFNVIPFMLLLQRKAFYWWGYICQKFHAESLPGKKVKLALLKQILNWWCKDTKNIPDNDINQRLFSWNINILNRSYFLKWNQ